MTHPSPRFRILPQLTAYAACLGLAFACAGATEGDTHDEPTTDAGPNNGGPTGGGPTTGGGNGGNTTTGGAVTTTTTGGAVTTTGGAVTTTGGAVTTGVVFDCPSIEPAQGTGCSVGAQVCAYANCTAPDYRDAHTFSCEGGAWQLTAEEVCEDVPTTCPPSITRGAYCNLPEGSGPCSVVDACGSVRDTYCTNNVWEYEGSEDAAPIIPGSGGAGTGASSGTATTTPPPVPQCPAAMPTYGAACCPADYPAYCDYSETGSDVGIGTGPGSEAVSGTGFGATGGAAPPPLTCAACGPDMTWTSSFDCP